MNKILHIMGSADVGGISSVVYNLYSNINKDNFLFDIALTTKNFGIDGRRLEELGCKFYFLPMKSQNIKKYKTDLKKILVEGKYDAIHVHENQTSYVALKIAKKCGITCRIAHSHTSSPDIDFKSKIKRLIGIVLNYRYATAVIGCGQLAGDRVFGKSHMKRKKAHVLLNGINYSSYLFNEEDRNLIRERLQINNKFCIGLVGRLSSEKNQLFALKIIYKFHEINPNIVLLLIGNGPDEELIHNFIDENYMNDYVKVLGARDDVNKLYSAMDVSILTSIHEGYPVVAIESLFASLPVILSSNITNELSKYDNVYYCNDSLDSWIDILLFLLNNNNRTIIDSNLKFDFDIKNIVKRLENIYLTNL